MADAAAHGVGRPAMEGRPKPASQSGGVESLEWQPSEAGHNSNPLHATQVQRQREISQIEKRGEYAYIA